MTIHRHHSYDDDPCYIHRRDEPSAIDPYAFTELDEELGDDYEGYISYTSSSTMERPVRVVTGDVPPDADHYTLVDEGRDDGLMRVYATQEIVIDGYGVIPMGERGGLVESEANLEQGKGCWITDGVKVIDSALVTDYAIVVAGYTHPDGESILRDSAIVADGALVFDSELSDESSIEGNVEAYECTLSGESQVYGDREMSRAAVLVDVAMEDKASVWGSPTLRAVYMKGEAKVGAHAVVEDSVLVAKTQVRDTAQVKDSIIGGDTQVYEKAIVNNSTIRGGSLICGDARVDGQFDVTDAVAI